MKEEEMEQWMPYLYWMDSIRDFGRVTNNFLLEKYGSPITIYNIEEIEIKKWIKAKQFSSFQEAKKRTKEEILKKYEYLREEGISFIPFCHKDFPDRLKNIPDPPFAIYVRGTLPKKEIPAIAMVGSRSCSEYGKYMAREFAKEFACMGYQIISGMALGIDGISQRVTLENGGQTFAVLGCGVDVCYPKENRDIYQKIPESGGIISEYAPGIQPLAGQFPPRNRIISAFADVILVIEAKEKSGTQITVDMALEQGKEVYAVPGRCTDLLSTGCNHLIRQGAGVAITPSQMIEEVYGEKMKEESAATQKNTIVLLSPLGQQMIQIMKLEPETLDEIYTRLLKTFPQKSLSITDMMCELMDLQIKGFVGRIGGTYHLLKI